MDYIDYSKLMNMITEFFIKYKETKSNSAILLEEIINLKLKKDNFKKFVDILKQSFKKIMINSTNEIDKNNAFDYIWKYDNSFLKLDIAMFPRRN